MLAPHPSSWLCVLTVGVQEGWRWSNPVGQWHCWGRGLKAFVSLQLTSLRGWTCFFLDESCSVMEKWVFPALAGNGERDLLALSDHHLLRSAESGSSVFPSPC